MEALRLAQLIATVRNETNLVLLEVIQDYDVRIGRVTELAQDLQGTLSEFDELHARSQQLADRAFGNVEIAQQASESLVDVLATYHQVIETQSSLLRERLRPVERTGLSVSLLPGLLWDDASADGGSMIFAQIGYSL